MFLQCSAFLGDKELADIGFFQSQQAQFFIDAAGIAGEAAIAADYPVAGDNDGDFIMPYRPADRLGRHMRQPSLLGNHLGNVAVGGCLPIGNLPQNFPHC